MTDGEIRDVVNELRAIAKNFAHTQQLRTMISSYIVPILQAARAKPADPVSDDDIQQWADTHGIAIHGSDLRCAFEDAASWRFK